MGLKEAFKAAAEAAFSAAGNVKTTISFTSVSDASYNETTGAVTWNNTTYSNIDVILDEYSNREIDANPTGAREGNRAVLPGDKKVYILYDDLTPTPKANDYVTISGQNWTVIGTYVDPAQAMWQLQVRLP